MHMQFTAQKLDKRRLHTVTIFMLLFIVNFDADMFGPQTENDGMIPFAILQEFLRLFAKVRFQRKIFDMRFVAVLDVDVGTIPLVSV